MTQDNDTAQEKTEDPTPRKRRKTREEGQVAKSVEVISVMVLLAGILSMYLFIGIIRSGMFDLMKSCFIFETVPELNGPYMGILLSQYSTVFLTTLAPLLLAVFVAALAANIIQVGFQISPQAITPKLSKISVIKGFGRLFSVKSLGEAVKSLFKLVVIGTIIVLVLRNLIESLTHMPDMTPAQICATLLQITLKVFIWTLLVMMVLALLDYVFQRWQFEKQIRMTKQEVKEEMKQTDGDPYIKSRIRSLQQEAARQRMMQEVPQADVVVTNPTHLAVAIRYETLTMAAPKVVAKGAGRVAEKIREIATDNRVPIIENKELARNLYKTVEVNGEIPPDFFRSVAELLAYVYRLKGKTL